MAELEEKILLDILCETVMQRSGNLGKGALRPPFQPSWIKEPRNRR